MSLSEWPLKPYPKNFEDPELNADLENYENILKTFGMEASEILVEWKTFKKALYSHYEKPNTLTWKEINAQDRVGHAQILAVTDPSASSDCE